MRDISNSSQQHPTSSITQQPREIDHSSTLDLLRHDPKDTERQPGHPQRRTWLWVVALIVVGLAILIGVRTYITSQAAKAKPKAPPPTPVVAAAAHAGDIPVYFTGLGAVTPIYTVTIKSRVDGQITNVYYKEGQTVRKGEPLVEIDPRPFLVQLTQAEGQLGRDKALLENAETDLKRYSELIPKKAVAEQIYATQKSTVAQDEGNVKTDEGNIASAKLNITYCHIIAPITGRVGLRLADPGNLVQASGGTALVVITQTQPISVIFTLPEQQVEAVLKRWRAGQHLPVEALDRDSKNVIATGELTTVDNQIDQTTGTLKFRATFANKDETLFANQFVNARLLLEEKKGVTLVSNAAIQRNGASTFVYVVQPDKTVKVRSVKVGTTGVDESEILVTPGVDPGVHPGDVVITQGVDKLQDGSVVQAQIQPAAGASAGANAESSNAGGASGYAGDSGQTSSGGHRNRKAGSSTQGDPKQNP